MWKALAYPVKVWVVVEVCRDVGVQLLVSLPARGELLLVLLVLERVLVRVYGVGDVWHCVVATLAEKLPV